ncbi:response regulator [Neorhizobium alkalisoli]|jgi:DNA-binding NtrC family response regulator|uniref:Response regulator receiver domain-containing protein n=1 Tax=Neorhizobium alkalisoli TaxID=528178 RepID=A0A561PUP8_9HYPH|nr:response regulator [Neorhizobium alkalisoli]TWF41820.1 response regulator receiver domain-containing protein [Neorhizobium alkalisoli]
MGVTAMPKAEAILVVEDEPVPRFLLVEELEEAGYEVFEAENASKAIEILDEYPDIRVMLTDIDLFAEAEGLELAKLVRERWPPIRIILTSGNWSVQQEELAFAESFIPKPHAPGALLNSIKSCLA